MSERHELTQEEQRAGGIASGAIRRKKREDAQRLALERLADKLTAADTVIDDALKATTGYATKDGEFIEHADYSTRLRAAAQVYDRTLGRPRQAIELVGDGGDPLEVKLEFDADSAARVLAGLVEAGLVRPGHAAAPDSTSQ